MVPRVNDRARRLVLCLDNSGYEASLDRRKAYELLPAEDGDDGMVRVIDESGEDYLYPAEMFLALDLPAAVEEALLAAV